MFVRFGPVSAADCGSDCVLRVFTLFRARNRAFRIPPRNCAQANREKARSMTWCFGNARPAPHVTPSGRSATSEESIVKTTSKFCIVALIAAGFGIGCSGEESSPLAPGNPSALAVDDPCGEVTTVRLIAGRTIDVGTVTVENDGVELCVRYETSGDWTLVESHLDIRLTPGDIPQNKAGNPKVGNFAYKHSNLGGVTVDEYCFLLDELGYTTGTELFVAAHAVVKRVVDGRPVQEETAWGEGP